MSRAKRISRRGPGSRPGRASASVVRVRDDAREIEGSMEHQDLKSQKGEIEFRRLLVRQQVAGDKIFQDELDAGEMTRLLEARMQDTATRIREIGRSGVTLAPYLEIGAERGQRALVLENDVGIH